MKSSILNMKKAEYNKIKTPLQSVITGLRGESFVRWTPPYKSLLTF